MKRMDKYKYATSSKESRLDKNQELYQNVSNNVVYTNITDVTNSNTFELSDRRKSSNYSTREAYQQMQKYQDVDKTPKVKKELEDFNYLYQKRENKVYDINTVLEEARKNRKGTDEKESKRKLKNQSYNILLNMNQEEIEKYREEKRKKINTPEEEELRELIDTIASKTLAGEIDKEITVDLLSDLMATNILDKVEASDELPDDEPGEAKDPIIEEIIVEETIIEKNDGEENKKDDLSVSRQVLSSEEVEKINEEAQKQVEKPSIKDEDFYTKSMDLSDKDFDMSDEFKEKKIPPIVVAIIVLVIMAIIATAVYFIYKRFM